MVYAEYRNNVDEYKRFCAFHLLYARGIRTYLFPAFFCLFAVLLIVMAVLSSNEVLYAGAAVLLIVAALLPPLNVWIQNGKINKRMRLDDSYEKVTQSFIFSAGGIHLSVRARGKTEEYDIPYSQVLRVYERKYVYYIYIGTTQALILRKAGIKEDEPGELQKFFEILGKRFRRLRKPAGGSPSGENL